MDDPCDAWDASLIPTKAPDVHYQDVAAVLRWCAQTGLEPHQNYNYNVHVTNVAGRTWNEWNTRYPELRSVVLRDIADAIDLEGYSGRL